MTDFLFDVPQDGPDELTAARLRLEKAQSEYDRADQWEDECGDPIPRDVRNELAAARHAVAQAEYRVLKRLIR